MTGNPRIKPFLTGAGLNQRLSETHHKCGNAPNYRRIRFSWMNTALRQFRKHGIFSEEEIREIKERYKNGFHVHFKPINGSNNDILFRTAEYLAAGYFHNSMIAAIDHAKNKLTLRYKSWVDRDTKEKFFSEMTLDIYDFMARMLFFLPDKHGKAIKFNAFCPVFFVFKIVLRCPTLVQIISIQSHWPILKRLQIP